jgi:hypothetical protein
MLTRRDLLGNMLKVSASLMLAPDAIGLAAEISPISLRLAGGSPVEIPANFIGLGYEMSSVAMPSLLRATNHRYVELIRGLGTEGVLRVGGIVANYTSYKPNGTVTADRKNTVVTRATLSEFAAFLRKIGWTAIWSLNFAQGTIAEAVEEARAVSDVLGSRLLVLEIGNEVNSYAKSQPFRSPSYNYETYLKEYKEWHAAIVKAVPGIRFAAPDTTSGAEDWVERMAQDAKGDVQLLTSHYYRNGQTRGTAEQLLTPDPKLADILARLRTASQQSAIPWRMCEINSFSGGGRPGVSDTFIDALWTLNTMLLLAQYGCAGVNMETGVNQLGFTSSYSPIQDNGEGVNSAAAPYYGMLAFARAFAGCHQMLPLEIGIQNEFLTAYVLGAGGKPRSVVVVNTDRENDAQISVAGLGMKRISILRLIAPSAESKTGVSFGGATVDETGRWKAMSEERVHNGSVPIPRMSAAVIRSET